MDLRSNAVSKIVMNRRTAGALKRLTTFVLILGIGFLLQACASDGDKTEDLKQASFDLQLENSRGERVSMKEFKGKKIFFNVWATWCPPCIEEMPTIHNLYEEVGDSGVEFLMLTMDQDFQKAIDFRNKYGYNFEIYRPLSGIPAMYHTKLIPTTFVINSEGYLVLQHDGMGKFDSEQFKTFLAAVE